MKIKLFSDTHFEFYDKHYADRMINNQEQVKVAVLAGDITTKSTFHDIMKRFVDRFETVLFVHGNHELYDSSFETEHDRYRKFELLNPNFKWFENRTVTLLDNETGLTQRFVGATMWYPFDSTNLAYEKYMSDFDLIRDCRNTVTQSADFTNRFLNSAVQKDDVVITHHLPSHDCNHPKWRNSQLSRFFVYPQDHLILDRQPKAWLFGHTHDPHESVLGQTRLISNPYGYPHEQFNPNPNKVIQL